MARGGARPGAGRPAGSLAKHNKLAREATAAAVGDGETPLAYLLKYMRDAEKPDKERLTAAIAAAGFVHHKLASIEHSGGLTNHDDAVALLEQEVSGTEDHERPN